MDTVSLESKERLSLEAISKILARSWRIERSAGDTLTVHDENSRAYLHPDLEVTEDGIHRLLLDYSDVDLAKKLLEIIADDPDDPNVKVDNDFGTVFPGDKFVSRCRAERGWNWRR